MLLAIRSFLAFLLPLILGAFAGLTAAVAQAQNASPGRGSGTPLLIPSNAARWLDSFSDKSVSAALVLLELDEFPDAAARRQLAGRGIRLRGYLGERRFIASLLPGKAAGPFTDIRGILPVDPAWKLAPTLRGQAWQKGVDVLISVVPELPATEMRSRIIAAGGNLRSSPLASHHYYEASVPASGLAKLAAQPEILYIGRAAEDVPLNLESQRATKASLAHAPRVSGGWGLLGDSITIGVGDNVPGLYHVDLRDRIVNYNPAGYGNHGQHVNGTVGGAGTMDPIGEGFAPHATLIDHLYSLVWARTGAMLQAHNMTVTNNSYANSAGSCQESGHYDIYSQVLDTVVLQYPEVFQVFAAGNDGGMTCAPYPPSYGTIPGGYQAAKNVLVVANATKQYGANPGTSRGPMRDGRLKPEIAAIGTDITSTKGGDAYLGANGTSMACPQIAGSAALLQQRYKQLHGGSYPATDLTKALLMNGALDIGNPGPDFTFGFGVADLSRTLTMLDSNRYFRGSIGHGSTQAPLSINVPPNTGQLKVMLYWHDVPASPMAATQLVNDLDLKLGTPGGATVLPFILDPSPAKLRDAAIQGADHLNNVEQVVIDHPAAGSYAVTVSGHAVPVGPQSYVLVYDLIPSGITLTSPFRDGAYKAGAPLNIYWNASAGNAVFSIDFSTDNGGNWEIVNPTVPAEHRQYAWSPRPGINSAQCRIRITRGSSGEQVISEAFTINEQPLLQLAPTQCPGYVALHWSPVPGVTGYRVLRKIGPFLQPVATVTDTSFVGAGLSFDSNYYFSVQPLFGAAEGYRSVAVNRVPNTGSCAGAISDGDLMIERIETPTSGRLFTSSALGASQNLDIRVRNLDDAASAGYIVAYQLNGGSWLSQSFPGLPAGNSAIASFTGLNLAAPGTYVVRAAVTPLAGGDPVPANDTFVATLRQLQNPPISPASGHTEDFESMPRLYLQTDTMGFSPDERWDYANSHDTARLRSFVDGDIVISGTRSISLDLVQNATPAFSRLTGTFNLAAANLTNDELRVEFDYRMHGRPRTADSNRVWARGADNQSWVPLFDYDRSALPGPVLHSGSLSMNDALLASGQSFSSSTQLAFGFRDTSVIAQNDYGSGLTIDNVTLYKVVNDAAIASVLSPAPASCALGAQTPLTISVRNGVSVTLTNILLYYQLDGGPVVVDTLSSIAGKTNQSFSFTQLLDASAYGQHTLSVWLAAPGDSYSANDSVLHYVFRNEPLIATFPYLEQFETGDGYWYAEGRNSSWAFGSPSSSKVTKAASGVKAWKTNLRGDHRDNELSYLYSPCFDISRLSRPMLSFSTAMEIENCGSFLCDGAWLEYAIGGGEWTRLGAQGQGTNWYDSASFQLWNSGDDVRWKVASIPIPAASQPVRFRYVLSSDQGVSYEGIAVDDVHIYDLGNPLYTGGTVGPIQHQIAAGGLADFSSGGGLLATINAGSADPGNTEVTVYTHDELFEPGSSQYYLPRNFVVNTQHALSDSVTLRLFVPDADVLRLVRATGCPHCTKPADAYELGITKYDHSDRRVENGSLRDNIGGSYEFIPRSRINWVPYDAGYYAELRLASFSELWFNGGGAGQLFPLTLTELEFQARKSGPESVLAQWRSLVDTLTSSYELQRSYNASDFSVITTIPSVKDVNHQYSYLDFPGPVTTPALYYRLKYRLLDGKEYYSVIRQVIWSGRAAELQVYPNPSPDGKLSLNWSALPGATLEVVATDMLGKRIAQASDKASAYQNLTQLDLGNVARGVYFLHVNISGERFDLKIEVI